MNADEQPNKVMLAIMRPSKMKEKRIRYSRL